MVLKVYKPLTPPMHYKDLCMIMTMKVDMCGVLECKPPITYLGYLIEFPKPPLNTGIEKLKGRLDKDRIEIDAHLESKHSRGTKRVKRWPLIRRKRLK